MAAAGTFEVANTAQTTWGKTISAATDNHMCLQLSLSKTAKQWQCNPVHRGPITISEIGILGANHAQNWLCNKRVSLNCHSPLSAPFGFRFGGSLARVNAMVLSVSRGSPSPSNVLIAPALSSPRRTCYRPPSPGVTPEPLLFNFPLNVWRFFGWKIGKNYGENYALIEIYGDDYGGSFFLGVKSYGGNYGENYGENYGGITGKLWGKSRGKLRGKITGRNVADHLPPTVWDALQHTFMHNGSFSSMSTTRSPILVCICALRVSRCLKHD